MVNIPQIPDGGELFGQTDPPKFDIAKINLVAILQLDNLPDDMSSEKFQERIRVLVERCPAVDDKKQIVGKIHSEIKDRLDKIEITKIEQEITDLNSDISSLNLLQPGMQIDIGVKKLKELKFQNCIPEWLRKDYSQLSNANVKIDDVKSAIKHNLTAKLQKREKIKKDHSLLDSALTYCQGISSSLNSTGKMPAVGTTAAAPTAPAPGAPASITFRRTKTVLFVDLVKEFNKAINSSKFKCEKSANGSYIWSGEVTQDGKKYFNKYELFKVGTDIKLRKTKYEIQGGAYFYVGSYESGDTTDGQLAKIFKAGDSYIAKRPFVVAGGPAAPQKPAPQAAKPAPAPRYGVTGGGPGARYTSLKDYTNNGEVVYKVGERTSDGHYDTSSGWAYKSDENGERTYGWLKGGVFSSEAQVAAGRQETDDQKLARISPKWRGALNNAKDILDEYNLYKQAYNEDGMTKIYLPRKEKAFLELSWSGGGLTITKKTDDHREKVLETAEYNLEKDKYGTQHLTKLSGGAAEDVFVSYNNATKTKEVLSGELFRIKHQELENRIKETISRAAGEEQKAYYEYSAYYDAHVVSGNNLVYMQDGVLELKTENGKIIAIKHDSTGKVTQANEYYVEAGKVAKKSYVAEKPLEKSEQQKSAVTEKAKEKAFVSADTLAKECKEIMTAKEGARIMLKDGTMLEVQHSVTWGRGDKIVTVKATSATGKVQKIKYEIYFNKRKVGSLFTKTYFDLDGAKEVKTKTETMLYDGTNAKIEITT